MKKILLSIVFYIFFIFCFTEARVFDAQEFYLNNGLRVLVEENHKAPVISHMVWYHVGSIDEPYGKGGLAHLLEHLMFRGTKQVSGSSFNDIMTQNGVDYNAFTTPDFTVYHETADISKLELVMALEADRMSELNILPDSFEQERKIVFEERQQRIENKSASRFMEEIRQIMWQNTPYAHPVSGTSDEILNLKQADAEAFYQKYYAPNNAVLILSGDIDVATAKTLAEKYYGNKKASTNIEADLPASFEKSVYFVSKELPDIATTKMLMLYSLPSMLGNLKDMLALELFAEYLSGGKNSYLEKYLVKTSKAVAASAGFDSSTRGPAVFSVEFLPKPDMPENSSLKILKEVLPEALKKFTAQKLEEEKKKMKVRLVYLKDNPEDAAYILGNLASLKLTLEEIETYAELSEHITLQDVTRAVQQVLQADVVMTAVLKPQQRGQNDTQN